MHVVVYIVCDLVVSIRQVWASNMHVINEP